jgi:hypothetical protein
MLGGRIASGRSGNTLLDDDESLGDGISGHRTVAFLVNTVHFLKVVRYRLRCRYLGWMTQQQGETRLVTTTEAVVLNRGERSSSRCVICAMSWTLPVLRGK